ncbi:MAG: hypothetical protein ACOYI4_07785 [Christensenellales bacterium]|jgi:hypothetical protein
MMVVAYQEGLEYLAHSLSQHGFQPVPYAQSRYADALLYHETGQGLLNRLPGDTGRLLLVNVYGKSLQQIIDILNHRTYTPLFS